MGHDLEAAAKLDHSIFIAANNLATTIPAITTPIIESHNYIATDKGGERRGRIRRGTFTVKHSKLPDGSLIQPSDTARKTITTILRKQGYEAGPIEEAIAKFEQGPANVEIEITPHLKVIKWSMDDVKPDLSNASLMNPLIPAKIAFEFLACMSGKAIYQNGGELSSLKKCFHELIMSPDRIKVERLYAKEIKPFHGICFEGNDPYARIQVRLFGFIAFRVHFTRVAVKVPRIIYTHQLDVDEEYLGVVED